MCTSESIGKGCRSLFKISVKSLWFYQWQMLMKELLSWTEQAMRKVMAWYNLYLFSMLESYILKWNGKIKQELDFLKEISALKEINALEFSKT